MIFIDTEFLMNNIPHMIFYVLYNTYTGYLFYTNTYYQNEYFVTSVIAYYEFINTFYEFRNRIVKKGMVAHHALTSANSFMLLYYYNTYPEIVRDVMCAQVLVMSSTLYLNIRYTFPKAWPPRLVFFISFFYYRFYLTYPYVYKALTGSYGDNTIVRIIYLNIGCLYVLSIYWGYLILRIAYKALKSAEPSSQ
jgi:hypothetical protein